MRRRRKLWLAVTGLFVVALGLLIPGSPIYVPDLLATNGQHDGQSTRWWTRALEDPDPENRRQAAHALGVIGSQAEQSVPKLATMMLDDPSREVRIEAALALSKMDPASKAVIPQLAQALADPEPFIRMNAARALFRLGPEARPAVPALFKALEDDENHTNAKAFTVTIHELAALALARATAGTEEAVPALVAALKRAPTDEVRVSMIRALGEVGPAARSVLPLLRPLAEDKNRNIKRAADEALQKIDGGSQAAGPAESIRP